MFDLLGLKRKTKLKTRLKENLIENKLVNENLGSYKT